MTTSDIGYHPTAYGDNVTGWDQIRFIYASSGTDGGTLDQFHIRRADSANSGARGAIFISSGRELLAQTQPFNGSKSEDWVSVDIGPSSITANTDYIVAVWFDESKQQMDRNNAGMGDDWNFYHYDSGRDYSADDSGDFSVNHNPLDADSNYDRTANFRLSMYLTYDVSNGGNGGTSTAGQRGDLNISGNNCSIDCWCSRWDVQDYSIIIETWLTKSELQDLRNSIRPGAVGELYKILGRPLYYDSSWDGSNTLKFTPDTNSHSTLYKMRGGVKLGYVKNITTSPLPGDSGWINVKLDCYISGSGKL